MVIKKSVLSEVCKSSSWSLLIYKSNTITYDKIYAVISKHIAENIPVLCYLKLIELLERNAKAITRNLKNFFIAKMLNTDNLMYFASDSASVILGI